MHGRTAEPVDRHTGDRARQIGKERDQTGDVKALLTLGEGAAKDQVLDRVGINAGLFDQTFDDLCRKAVRTNLGKGMLTAR